MDTLVYIFRMGILAEAFYKGRYKEVLEKFWDGPVQLERLGPAEFVIGALSFSGRLEEAEQLLIRASEWFTSEQLIEARFYLAINLCRTHLFEKACEYLLLNLRARSKDLSSQTKFFLYQGLAFHHSIGGRPRLALRWGRLAGASASDANFLYGRLLTEDMIAHSLVQAGEVHQGLRRFERAAELAEKSDSPKLSQTFLLSATVYRCQLLLLPGEAIEALEAALAEFKPDNVFAVTALKLELANQKIWTGQLDAAQRDLDSAAELIYGTSHFRNRILLNLRYAFINALRGNQQFSLSQLTAIRPQLDPKMT